MMDLKQNGPVEAYIKVKREGCDVAKITSSLEAKVYVERIKLGGRNSMHIAEFERLNRETYRKIRNSFPSVAKIGERKLLIESRSCHFCQALAESKIVLMGGKPVDGGSMLYHVIAISGKSLKELETRMKKQDVKITIVGSTPYVEDAGLTERQFQIISLAAQMGFFDVDRKTTLERLAKQLSISPAALNETFRRGLGKIVDDYLRRSADTRQYMRTQP